MAKGIIFDTEFKIHYTIISGKKKINEVTKVFCSPMVFYSESENNIFDSESLIDMVLVKNQFCKFKSLQEGKIINKKIQVIRKLVNLGKTNYEI